MKIKIVLILFFIIGIISCNSDNNKSNPTSDKVAPIAVSMAKGENTNMDLDGKVNRKLTKHCQIKFINNDLNNCKIYVDNLIKIYNGLIINEQFNKSDITNYTFETSIPSRSFDEVIRILKTQYGNPENMDLRSEDFTKSYYDTESRLKSKKVFLDKCLDLLSKAKKIEDILAIEQKVAEVQDEIDEMTKTMKNYDFKNDNYTLIIEFQTEVNSIDNQNTGFFQSIIKSFISGFSYASDLINFIISKWPLWIILAIFYYIFRKFRNKKSIE